MTYAEALAAAPGNSRIFVKGGAAFLINRFGTSIPENDDCFKHFFLVVSNDWEIEDASDENFIDPEDEESFWDEEDVG